MSRSIQQRWERACAYLGKDHLPPAYAQLEALRAVAPDDARTCLLGARVAWQADHPQAAATYALAAAQAVPDDAELLCAAVDALLQTGETAAAHALLARPAWQQTERADVILRYADFRQRLGEHASALTALDRLAATHASDAAFHWYRGQQREFLGQLEVAAADYATCLALAPDCGQAAYQWVRLGLPTPPERQLAVIEAGLRQTRPDSREHADFEFARHHVLDARGEVDAAWSALAAANAIMHARVSADAERQQRGVTTFVQQIATQPMPLADAAPAGPRPIFVIGLPRSGTTVLERMLGNHSQVVSAGELADFGQQLLRAADTRSTFSAAFFARLPHLDLGGLGRRYLAQTTWRAANHAGFIDKQPANWMLAGLIHAALPHARIVHVVRDPMDVCFSLWRARFVGVYTWTYDFASLARQYALYRELMRHWHALQPGAILDVAYADLVRDPVATLRTVFAHCGLAWEPGCEDLARNDAPVCTLSAAQVREPVHARSLGQWRRYAMQLAPLEARLAAID